MTELFLQILNTSLSATWLVLAVIALRFLLKKAPKWVNVLLWGLVAFRLLCPFTLESALSLIPSAEVISPEIMLDPTPQIHTGFDSINTVVNPVITETFSPEPAASANPLQIWIPVVSVVWCIGMSVMLLYTIASYARLRYRVRMAIRVKRNIYLSEFVTSPFVLGIFRPRIYLPYHMSDSDRAHVIAHERAHIYRRDHWWKPLGFLLLTLHWFNPAMWVAYILLCRDIELACDEKVIKELGVDQRADYSQALLHCSVTHHSIAACPLAFGEVGVKERVKNVLSYKKPAFWVILISIILCIIVAVCFLTDPLNDDLIQQVVEQDGYTITSQESKNINLVIQKAWLPEDCLTLEGHTFEEKEIVPYSAYADNILYLKHVGYEDETKEYLTFTFDFVTESPEDGKLLLPYSVNIENGLKESITFGCAVVRNEVWDNKETYSDAAYFRGQDGISAFSVNVKTEVYESADHHIAFMLSGFNELTYKEGSSEENSTPFGHTYHVEEITYADARISMVYDPADCPLYRLTSDKKLDILEDLDSNNWLHPGTLEEFTLTPENFDAYFTGTMQENETLCSELRSSNARAWQVFVSLETSGSGFQYLLLQENGDLYITQGNYYPDSDKHQTTITHVFRLVLDESQTALPVTMALEFVSRTRAHLTFTYSNNLSHDDVQIPETYTLERLASETWEELPRLREERDLAIVAEIDNADYDAWSLPDWSEDYGTLPDGTYRIKKEVTHAAEPFSIYAEFTIGGTAEDYITYTLEDITPTGAALYEQETVDDTFSLIYEKGFWLETLQDGQWTYLEPTSYVEPSFTSEKQYVYALHSSDGLEIDWSHLYGELPSGAYRIAKEVTYVGGPSPSVLTAYAEFTVGSDWGIDLFLDRLSENSVTVNILVENNLPAGEYYFAGSTLQLKERIGGWTDVIPMSDPSYDRDITSDPACELIWDVALYRLTEGDHRIGIRIKHVLPNGTTEYNTIYEYFDPASYAWGVSLDVTNVTHTDYEVYVEYQQTFSATLPEGSLRESSLLGLQKRENNQWIDVERKIDYSSLSDIPTHSPGSNAGGMNLLALYDDISSGTYRLVSYVTRHYENGDTDTRPVYAIFAVDTPVPLPNTLSSCIVREGNEEMVTVTNSDTLKTLRTLFASAKALTTGPDPEDMTLNLTLIGTGGSTVTILLDWHSDTCWISGQYYDYGPGENEDASETLFDLLQIARADPGSLMKYVDTNTFTPPPYLQAQTLSDIVCIDLYYQKGLTCLTAKDEIASLLSLIGDVIANAPQLSETEIQGKVETNWHNHSITITYAESAQSIFLHKDGSLLWLENSEGEKQIYSLTDFPQLQEYLAQMTDGVKQQETSGTPFATKEEPWNWTKNLSNSTVEKATIYFVKENVSDGHSGSTLSTNGTFISGRFEEMLEVVNAIPSNAFSQVQGNAKNNFSRLRSQLGSRGISVFILDRVNSLGAMFIYKGEGTQLVLCDDMYKVENDSNYLHDTATYWDIDSKILDQYMQSLMEDTPIIQYTVGAGYEWGNSVEFSEGNYSLTLDLIEDWEYEIVEYSANVESFGIRCRPGNVKSGWIYFSFWPDGYAPQEENRYYNEGGWMGYPSIRSYPSSVATPTTLDTRNTIWSFYKAETDNGDFAVINESADDWFLEYEEAIEDTISLCRFSISE